MSPRFSGSLASVDGQVMLASRATIPATDPGLLRGDGAFEVVRVYDGRTFALEEHLKRLERSASNLRLAVDLDAIRTDARRLLSHAGAGPDHELLRIVVTRGGCRLLLTEPLPGVPDRARLGTITYAPTRILDGVKSLSYGADMLASRMARERGYDEALLVSPHGTRARGPDQLDLRVPRLHRARGAAGGRDRRPVVLERRSGDRAARGGDRSADPLDAGGPH